MRRVISFLIAALISSSLPAVAASHGNPWPNAGSALGSNLEEIENGSDERPFLNLFKEGGGWFTATSSSGDTGDEATLYAHCVDSNHYLNVDPATCATNFGTTFTRVEIFVNVSGSFTPPYPAGNYVLLWDGNGNSPTTMFQTNMSGLSDTATETNCPITGVPNRILFNFASPGNVGVRQEIDQTTIGTGGSPPTNIRFVYSPDSTCSVVGTREALLATAPSCSAVGTNTSGIFDPVFLTAMQYFNPIRFMKWNKIDTGSTPITDWSQRALPCWAFWNDGGAGGGGTPLATTSNPMDQAVPYEIQIALCNKLNADCWFNEPFLFTQSAMSSLATLVHTNLNTNLKAYVEPGNEWWNVTNAEVNTGVFAAGAVRGNAAYPCSGNAHPTDSCPSANPGTNNQKWTDFSVLQFVLSAQAWQSVWGSDFTRVYPILGGQNGNTGLTQFLMDFQDTYYGGLTCSGCSGNSWTGKAATQVKIATAAIYWPLGAQCPRAWTANSDGGVAQCVQQIAQGGQLETGVGANTTTHTSDSLNACSVATGIAANHYSVTSGHSYASLVNGKPVQLKFDTAILGACDDLCVDSLACALLQQDQDIIINNISGTPANISGTTLTVTANGNMPTCCSAPIEVGGTVNGPGVTAGTFVTAVVTGSGFAGTYTVNKSQTVTCAPCTVGVPLPPHDWASGGTNSDTTTPWIFVFTNATSASSMTASWRESCGGLNCADYPGGWIVQQLNNFLANDLALITQAPYNLQWAGYEGGPGFLGLSNGDELSTLSVSMARSPLMGKAVGQYLGGLQAAGANGPFAFFKNYGAYSFHGETWGLLEDSQQATSLKYQAAIDSIRRNPCWWGGCRH